MAQHASLRFEPVSCVVTVLGDGLADDHCLDAIGPNSTLVREHDGVEEHYPDLHGSVLYIGRTTNRVVTARAAIILELPTGRRRAVGEARLHAGSADGWRLSIDASTEDGERVALSLDCGHGAAAFSNGHRRSAT